MASPSAARLLDALVDAVGHRQVLTEPDMVAGHVRDWTGRWTGWTLAVVRPGDSAQVRRVVELCAGVGVSLVPQGGNTGLVGGSIPHRGEVVVSMRRLDWLGPVEATAREVAVGAGATIAAIRRHAAASGLAYGVDLASRDTATIGGTIATNAGGMHVVAHGDTGRQVLGLEAVLADGSLVSTMDRARKQSVGPDPLALLVGSEGTLGLITAARLRLVEPPPGERYVVLVAVDRLQQPLDYLGPETTALEFFDRECLEAVVEHRGWAMPLPPLSPYYVLLESGSAPDLPGEAAAVVDPRLWRYREAITETINVLGVPIKLDVSVPAPRLDEFAAGVRGLGLGGRVFLFGHLAEGNFHVNVVDPPEPDLVVDRVLELVIALGGGIASEHGVGVAKAAWWRRSTDPGLLEMQRRVKAALDPMGILNPHVLWDGCPVDHC